mgnify:FL=1
MYHKSLRGPGHGRPSPRRPAGPARALGDRPGAPAGRSAHAAEQASRPAGPERKRRRDPGGRGGARSDARPGQPDSSGNVGRRTLRQTPSLARAAASRSSLGVPYEVVRWRSGRPVGATMAASSLIVL